MSEIAKPSEEMDEWARNFAGIAKPAPAAVKTVAPIAAMQELRAAAPRRVCDVRRLEMLVQTMQAESALTLLNFEDFDPLYVAALDPAMKTDGLQLVVHGPWNPKRDFIKNTVSSMEELRETVASMPAGSWVAPWFGEYFGMWAAKRFFIIDDDAYSYIFAPIAYGGTADAQITPSHVVEHIKAVIERGGNIPHSLVMGG